MTEVGPRGPDSTITLDLLPEHTEFLRARIGAVRDGLLGDLEHPERLGDPGRVRLQADALRRLLVLLDGEPVVVDDGMRAGLDELARSVDAMNEHRRVTFEHAVLWGVIRKIEQATAQARRTPPDGHSLDSGS